MKPMNFSDFWELHRDYFIQLASIRGYETVLYLATCCAWATANYERDNEESNLCQEVQEVQAL